MTVQHGFFTDILRAVMGGYKLYEIKEMWAEQHYPGLSKGGINGYEIAYQQAKPYYNWPFIKIKYRQWQSCINDIRKQGLHYSSQKKFKNLVGQLCDFAIKNEWAEFNYAPMLQIDRNRPVMIKTPFSVQEIRKLWSLVGRYQNVDLVLVLIYTGLRVSEFLRVRMHEDVFLDSRYFIVRESKTEAGRNRLVPIHNDLKRFFKQRMKFEYLATTKRGEYFQNYPRFRTMFKNVMDQVQMNHSIHETRHTCATLLDSVDANEMAIKKILGHAGVGVTKAVYIHKQLEDLLTAIDKLKGRDI